MSRSKLLGTLCIIGTTICYGFIPSLSFLSFGSGVKPETLLFDKFLYAAIINTFEPAVACILGYLIICDVLTKGMLTGTALLIVAVLIANVPTKHNK